MKIIEERSLECKSPKSCNKSLRNIAVMENAGRSFTEYWQDCGLSKEEVNSRPPGDKRLSAARNSYSLVTRL